MCTMCPRALTRAPSARRIVLRQERWQGRGRLVRQDSRELQWSCTIVVATCRHRDSGRLGCVTVTVGSCYSTSRCRVTESEHCLWY